MLAKSWSFLRLPLHFYELYNNLSLIWENIKNYLIKIKKVLTFQMNIQWIFQFHCTIAVKIGINLIELLAVSLVLWFWKWLEFWLGGKWWGFMADSKQKCLNKIVGDTRIGVFWFGQKSLRIYFFSTWKAKNQWILSINAVSTEKPKRRILAALWRSPVLSILQTEN